MATEAEVMKKVIKLAERELSLEEYARFLATITPKAGDSVKELREYRDKATYDDILKRLKKKGAKVVP
ncbi:MAG: hypothetical protein ACE5G7_03345 [Candidatus Hydrothermarchaeaceae archaeon]